MNKELYPILEYDDAKEAIINPELLQNEYGMLPYNKLIITFFKDAINKLLQENLIEPYLTINGENELLLYKFVDEVETYFRTRNSSFLFIIVLLYIQ
jgi:hypothetical protein